MKPDSIRRMSLSSPPSPPTAIPLPRQVFQVNELLGTLKQGLEMNFPPLWVEGEISNFLAARSGHWYFTLKDDRAQIRCACFRNRNSGKAVPSEGQRVLVRGQATIYTQRGELQLIVEDLEDAGVGALHQAFERLKRKLQNEGLFETERKRPVPASPRCIGIITSADGAALHDILVTLRRRNPLAQVRLYPSLVQGLQAVQQLQQALQKALADKQCDVLLLTRGGGSLEDLQAFNDEGLARDIAAAHLPIVSAVGHEVDFSICDFVSDVRAATPTAAAELLSPDAGNWQRQRQGLEDQLQAHMQRKLALARQNQQNLHRRLQALSPNRRLQERSQWLDDLNRRLQQSTLRQIRLATQGLTQARQGLMRQHPHPRLQQLQSQHQDLQQALGRQMQRVLQAQRQRLLHTQQRLQALSPEQILQRGYSITRHGESIVRDPDLPPGTTLSIQLAHGRLCANVGEQD